jgi:3-methylcrotonyl-CoA carboxylase alpha subunit
LYERECSIQRRYQKIIEESPSPTLDQATREKMGKAAVDIAKAIDYDSAGTLEFLVDTQLNFYFLEMNTRIQVEHPVTEMVTGIDIVKEQILIAAGNPLSFAQKDIQQNGHAIEARIYAEEPENDYRPSPGDITFYQQPDGQHIRIDAAMDSPTTIHSFFDPMISKLIAHGSSREMANERLVQALLHYIIHGINTNIAFLIEMLLSEDFIQNKISTKYCDQHTEAIVEALQQRRKAISMGQIISAFLVHQFENSPQISNTSIWNTIGYWRAEQKFTVCNDEDKFEIEVEHPKDKEYIFSLGDEKFCCTAKEISQNQIRLSVNAHCQKMYISEAKEHGTRLSFMGHTFTLKRSDLLYPTDFFDVEAEMGGGNLVKSPMPGKLIKIDIEVGQEVQRGQRLMIVEAMKTENSIVATRDAIVKEIRAVVGSMVDNTSPLVIFEDNE